MPHSLHDEWPELEKLRFHRTVLHLMFTTLPNPVTKALKIVGLGLPQVNVTKLGEDENVVMRLDLQPAIPKPHRNWSQLFSVAEWPEPNVGFKRSRSEKNDLMYAQTAL